MALHRWPVLLGPQRSLRRILQLFSWALARSPGPRSRAWARLACFWESGLILPLFGVLLLDQNKPPHNDQNNDNHNNIEVTMTIYAHAALDEKQRAAEARGCPRLRTLPSALPSKRPRAIFAPGSFACSGWEPPAEIEPET